MTWATGDTGSAARFFYCAMFGKTATNDGKTLGCHLATHQSSNSEVAEGRSTALMHQAQLTPIPTVKPTALMRYLCRLVTPPGGVVSDRSWAVAAPTDRR